MNQELGKIKTDFPIFKNHPNLVYLDNASTTQTPQVVLDVMDAYYTKYRANIHRGIYKLSNEATEMYEVARQVVADSLEAKFEEVIFTSGATQGLNMLAQALGKDLKPGDNVVLTRMEHHANLIPWQEMSRRYGFELRFIELENYELQTSDDTLKNLIDKNTKIVSFTLVSNTLGTINNATSIIERAKSVGAIMIIDAAQAMAHFSVSVKTLNCDFLVFSGHKMYGPTGIGVLYGKRERLEKMDPVLFGGDMIKEVTFAKAIWNDIPWRFEAGTPNIGGAIGLATATQYLQRIGWLQILEHEVEVMLYAMQELQRIGGLTIIGPIEKRVGVISFILDCVHPHDIASVLDTKYNIAVRAGHHCTMPLMQYLGIPGTTRASFGIYNSREDVDRLVEGIKEVKRIFS
ncbi:MAG: SufS family cysteine desulfurase [Patescibacteria group bacterium]|mgnify:CR=1 FL=1